MSAELPTATHSGTVTILGHELTMHQLSDGRRIFEDTPGFRALMAFLDVTISDGGVTIGLEPTIDAEVVDAKP